MDKKIVCYFSASGTTKMAAEHLAALTNSDLFEIVPTQKYTVEDLDWHDSESRSSEEMADSKLRPKMESQLNNLGDYSVIFIGYPIWWGLAPRIINTFIESVSLENKKVYLFATSGGSGIENSVNALKREYPNINFVSGKRLSRSITIDEVNAWIGE